jgi:DNA mismatch endonuclease Vsr
MDILDPLERSRKMSLIRSRGNKETELTLVKLLRQHNIKSWRRHQPISGRPDFVFKEARVGNEGKPGRSAFAPKLRSTGGLKMEDGRWRVRELHQLPQIFE